MSEADSKRKVSVYVIQDMDTGLYEAGEGNWRGPSNNRKWVPICTAKRQDEAVQYDDDDFKESYPEGLPYKWEKIKVSEFERRTKE